MKTFCWKFLSLPLAVIFVALCLPAPRGEAQTKALMIAGTWKLNLAKSKFGSGAPLKSRILTWGWDGETLTHTADSISSTGERSFAEFTAKFDGKEYPVFENRNYTAPVRHVSMQWIDAYTFEVTNPKSRMTYRHVISRDGKTDTITQKTASGKDQPVVDVLVYDKQ